MKDGKVKRNKWIGFFRVPFFLCWLVLLPLLAESQTGKLLKWRPEIENKKGYGLLEVFGSDSGFFYALHDSGRRREGYQIQKIGTDSLDLLATKTFAFTEVKGEKPSYQGVIILGQKTYFITSTGDNKADSITIAAFRLEPDLSVSKTPLILATAHREAMDRPGAIQLYHDREETVLCIIVSVAAETAKNGKFELRLFDTDLALLNTKQLEVPYAKNRVTYEDALIDSAGGIYLLAGIRDNTLSDMDGKRNIGRDFSLFKYNWSTDALEEKSLSLGTKWLYDVRIFLNDRANIQVAGYYSNMIDLIMAGTFSLELGQDGTVINQGLSPFAREFRSRFRPNSSSQVETELGKFKLDFLHIYDSGVTQLISEKNYTETSTVFNPGTGTYSVVTVYNFDQLLVSQISADSKILFNVVIPKFQSASRQPNQYSSFTSYSRDSTSYVVYNDNERNHDLNLHEERSYRQLTGANNAEAILIIIYNNGSTKKLPLFASASEKVIFNPNFRYEAADGLILVAGNGFVTKYFKLKID